jgi:NDP-sugar pyrophosphorylase family protein
MKVIIPLAGFGTRLRPHTYTKPKPLINVAGKPVLGHLLDKLSGLNIEEIVFIVGYLGDQIETYVSANYDFKSVGFVTGLFAWCIFKVVTTQDESEKVHGFEFETPDKEKPEENS